MIDKEKLFIILMACIYASVGILYGVSEFATYEGYFCKPVIQDGNTVTINAWCGHDGKLITTNGKTVWQIKGWNFGDFP